MRSGDARARRPKRSGRLALFAGLALALALVLGPIVRGRIRAVTGMPGESHRGPLPTLGDAERELASALERHVRALAEEIGPRSPDRPEAKRAAREYLRRELGRHGLEPVELPFEIEGVDFANLELRLPGSGALAGERFVVGAHYDSVRDSPGADDDASGVAVLLELAPRLAERRLGRSLSLVFFDNEEAGWSAMGSRRHAEACAEADEPVAGMISLEMLGYYRTEAGSQRYPSPLYSLVYPDVADFVAFVGDLPSRVLVRAAIGAFRAETAYPSEGMAAPRSVEDARRSDHYWYWRHGIPALMVTDTSEYRNPHYHLPTDRADTLDYERMARVAAGLERAIARLANASSLGSYDGALLGD